MIDRVTIALAKGRMLEQSLVHLKAVGLEFPGILETRRLNVPSACGRAEALIVRSADVPTYVSHGVADLGIVGKDTLWETAADEDSLLELLDLGFGRCRLVMASPAGRVPGFPVWRVATKYPLSAERAFQNPVQPVEIIKLYGSVELAPNYGMADVIVDLVETGSTLAANNLKIIKELGVSTARLIANRVSYKVKSASLRPLCRELEKCCEEN